MTVGEWATKRNITMSEGQSTCPACNTDLSEAKGVVAIDSDGIKTYYYQDSFDENPLIKTITISPANEDIYKCGCKVFLQNILNLTYQLLLSDHKPDNSLTVLKANFETY